MKWFFGCLLLVVALVAFVGCSRVNGDNYLKIKEGMSYDEVEIILGKPAETRENHIYSFGMTDTWRSGNAEITIEYSGGHVASKSSRGL
jgi:hypothetical protein